MSDKFKALLEHELLSEDVKSELKEAVEEYKASVVESVKKEMEVDFAKRFERDKTEISTKLFSIVNESVDEEIKELKEDIEYFRGLEIKYAKRLEEFKKEYAEKLSESFNTTVQNCVAEEIAEMHQDILEAKQSKFGAMVFESFKEEFVRHGFAEDVRDVMSELEVVQQKLKESEKVIDSLHRENIMGSLLGNLTGSKRNVMKTILENVATDKLEARYDEALSSVLDESVEDVSEDKSKLTESEEKGTIISEPSISSGRKAELERLRQLSRR